MTPTEALSVRNAALDKAMRRVGHDFDSVVFEMTLMVLRDPELGLALTMRADVKPVALSRVKLVTR